MKYAVILATIILFATLAFAGICPAPFQNAKAMALKVPMDIYGRHLINMTINRDGSEVIYIMGYIPQYGIIGIGKFVGSKVTVYEYNENTDEFSVYSNGTREPIDRSVCIRQAFQIFREMVTETLL